MLLQSSAKINLALNILGKDKNTSYHFIETVLHEYKELYDEIDLQINKTPSIEIRCEMPNVPVDETNSMFKAVRLLQNKFFITQGVKIYINKKIPTGSGLGGGSSNAAQVLKTLNKKWSLDLPNEKLEELSASLSTDTPFFIRGGMARGTHFGEIINPIPDLKCIKISIYLSNIFISTKWAYQQIKKSSSLGNREKTQKLVTALKRNNIKEAIRNLNNDFEDIIFMRYPQLQKKKSDIETKENSTVLLSGSGSSLVSYTVP